MCSANAPCRAIYHCMAFSKRERGVCVSQCSPLVSENKGVDTYFCPDQESDLLKFLTQDTNSDLLLFLLFLGHCICACVSWC